MRVCALVERLGFPSRMTLPQKIEDDDEDDFFTEIFTKGGATPILSATIGSKLTKEGG